MFLCHWNRVEVVEVWGCIVKAMSFILTKITRVICIGIIVTNHDISIRQCLAVVIDLCYDCTVHTHSVHMIVLGDLKKTIVW